MENVPFCGRMGIIWFTTIEINPSEMSVKLLPPPQKKKKEYWIIFWFQLKSGELFQRLPLLWGGLVQN